MGIPFEQTASNRKPREGLYGPSSALQFLGLQKSRKLVRSWGSPNDFAVTSFTSITGLLERAA